MQKSVVVLAVTACFTLAAQAQTANTATTDAGNGDVEQIVVIGTGETRSVSSITPASLTVLPPGTSLQKSLNFLPGVMSQSIDALGVNEQSMTLQVRGFSTTHLGYTLDGMPLGDGAYNNYNGLTISRALISENLGRADLATGIAGLSIASTSNLGGAITYATSAPHEDFGMAASQTIGSANGLRTFARIDTGTYDGFSAYLSGQYDQQDLFVNQGAYKTSTGKQFNGKAQYQFDRGMITAFADYSMTNQADDPYMSKEMINRLGWDFGGYAPDWQSFVAASACPTPEVGSPTKCVQPTAPATLKDARSFTNGQILRNDALFYIAGDYAFTDTISGRLQLYHHDDKGDGNNFIAAVATADPNSKVPESTQGTPTPADDIPVQMRDTRYTINRNGGLATLNWDLGFNHLQGGLWLEENISSAARYIWTNVTGPYSLGQFQQGQPSTAQWAQKTNWNTQQFYIQDTMSLFEDALSIDFGFKGTKAKSDALAIPGISAIPAPSATAAGTTQFATGSLTAKDYFMPQAGARWKLAPGHEIYASYSENMAMFQGGFKLGPQSVPQSVWNVQGATLKPETSKSFDGGYRYVGDDVQLSLALYNVDFKNRLLQYNPCSTALAASPGCGNSFHNAGSVTSKGVELGVQWQPVPWLNWYNSASLNQTTYNSDLNFCSATGTGCALYATAGKQQVDTPKQMYSSVLSVKQDGFWATLTGKFTGRRYYTYTNDQGFGAYTTLDFGAGFDFGSVGLLHDAKLALNVTNLTDLRYAANFDNSAFVPSDPTGTTALIAHASAPRQFFITLSAAL